MGKVHFVFGDSHVVAGADLSFADLIGNAILDIRPDVVVDLGDTADMPSLCSYDRGLKSFQGRTYRADIAAHNEFQDRVWSVVRKSKKKLPRRIRLIGNHEQRIDRAIQLSPELEGTISYNDLDLGPYYPEVVDYEGRTPGTIEVDGIVYSHYQVSGAMGRPISTLHSAYTLCTTKLQSCTVGHAHAFDHRSRKRGDGTPIMGTVCPMANPVKPSWVGTGGNGWDSGVIIKHDVEDGHYDIEYVSMTRLKRIYG